MSLPATWLEDEEWPYNLKDSVGWEDGMTPGRGEAVEKMAQELCVRGFAYLPTGPLRYTTPEFQLAERAVDLLGEYGDVKIIECDTLHHGRLAILALARERKPLGKYATQRAILNARRLEKKANPPPAPTPRPPLPSWVSRGIAKVQEAVKSVTGLPARKPNQALIKMRRYSTVEARPVEWLWPQRIALGKLTLIAGDPGLGKSFVTLDMAAHVSTGRSWPDGTPCPTGSVILLNCEDDPEDTIRPRLDKAGADAYKIVEIEGMETTGRKGEKVDRGVTLQDIGAIEFAIKATDDCRLVVVDPVSAYLSDTDSHKNAEIRGLLAPLTKLAQQYRVAIVMVTHLSKGSGGGPAMYRSMGSLAFVAAARAAFTVAKDKSDPDRRLFLPIKNNIGNDRSGLAYSIIDGAVTWEKDEVTTTADEALSFDSTPGPDPEVRDEAKRFLQTTLAFKGLPATEVYRQAGQAGITKVTLERAKKELGIMSRKQGFSDGGGWVWELPSVSVEQLIRSSIVKPSSN